MEMSPRYRDWIALFKMLNDHSPTKEEIDHIAPLHIRDEYYKLHPPEEAVSKSLPKVRLKRTYDDKDCLPQPFLKKRYVEASSPSARTSSSHTSRDSPQKRPSDKPASQEKTGFPGKPAERRSLPTLLQSNIFDDVQKPFEEFVLPKALSAHSEAAKMDSDDQAARCSPGIDSPPDPEIFTSPVKPMLLSQPIICQRVGSLLGAVSDVEDEKENTDLSSSSDTATGKGGNSGSGDGVPEDIDEQPFPDEKDRLKKTFKKADENYRRLKMKKSYVRGTSEAKKKFRKWRKMRKKR